MRRDGWRERASSDGLTHLDPDGAARMVDVGAKPESERRAVAEARVRMYPETARAVEAGDGPKGDVLGTARIAGIGAAKQAGSLVPLAHPLPLSFVDVAPRSTPRPGLVDLTAEARCVGRTGVEIEAMAAASVAALTVYDMVKALERGVEIERVRLLHKSGGKSGEWNARWLRLRRAAILTISSSRAAGGEAEDESGDGLAAFAESIGAEVIGAGPDRRRPRPDRRRTSATSATRSAATWC